MNAYMLETFRPHGGGYMVPIPSLEEGIAEARRYWENTGGRDGANVTISPICTACGNTGWITVRTYKRKPPLRKVCTACRGKGVLDPVYIDTGA